MPYQPPKFQNLEPESASKRVPQGFDLSLGREPSFPPPRRRKRQGSIRSLDMRLAYLLSIVTHLSFPFVMGALALLVMLILGIDLSDLFSHPVHKKSPDLEFVLTPPDTVEKPPLNPDTHYRAEKNMQAGGEHDPSKEVTLVEDSPPPAPTVNPASAPALPPPLPVAPPKPVVAQTPPPASPKPMMEAPKPQIRRSAPHAVERTKPVIATPPPLAKSIERASLTRYSTSPVVFNPNASSQANTNNTPSPQMTNAAPTGLQRSLASRSAGGVGSVSNPGPGNKNAALGVDAIKEPDFGPYMRDLQRRIKQTWRPPRGNESKRVVVIFRINRSGELQQVKVAKSSGEPVADQAAIVAIQQTFPFRPLPPEYAEENVDIEFTFDYNVFGDKQRIGRYSESG